MNEYSDKELLEQFRNESTRNMAFNQLVRKYQKRVYWHIRRLVVDHDDADDVTQNTFIKAWKGLLNFKEDSQLFTWLYRIATNESFTFLKQKKASLNLPLDDASYAVSKTLTDDNFFTGDEIQKKLQRAILTLPEKQRIVFNMKYFDEMKYEEMSRVLDTSVGALKASYHIAVKKIEAFVLKEVENM
ncbi:MAG TPA: sigma-70 family RNA polymerase sigma factor [Bacteroidia bacterium]|jgi:RNA polymerase sigma factor (sigma-70 family)|nr:sigma-70 family RNA polymerase sigma factor [Bacteroidia bacterium]